SASRRPPPGWQGRCNGLLGKHKGEQPMPLIIPAGNLTRSLASRLLSAFERRKRPHQGSTRTRNNEASMQREKTNIGLPAATLTPFLTASPATGLVFENEASRASVPLRSFGKRAGSDAALVIPDEIDGAFELAFLRGGGKEVLRLHLFDLLQRGHLAIIDVKGW